MCQRGSMYGCREQDRQMEDTEKLGGWQTYERKRVVGDESERDERWTVKDTRPHEGRLKRPSPYILSRNDRGKASGEGGGEI